MKEMISGNSTSKVLSFIAGAGTVYLLDPSAGHRRRVFLQDKAVRHTHSFIRFLDVATRDLGNRSKGFFGAVRYKIKGRQVSDDVLVRRVASKMGRFASHPKAIGITAENGVVSLIGPVLSSEQEALIHALYKVPGVKKIKNDLTTHLQKDLLQEEDHSSTPPFQTVGRSRSIHHSAILRREWPPALRLLVGSAGTWMLVRSLRRSDFISRSIGFVGAALIGRSITSGMNLYSRRLISSQQKQQRPETQQQGQAPSL